MMLWIVASLLTLAACLVVLRPFLSRARKAHPDSAHDLEVYRDQLDEVERDLSRGLIGEADAREARAEIARRLLKAEDEAAAAARPVTRLGSRWAATIAVLAVPVIGWGAYWATGSPGLPAQPLAARMAKNPADNTVQELVARAERHLRANPQDGRGWQVLAPIYMRMNRFEEAGVAYRNALRLLGDSAPLLSGYGEALAAIAGGTITTQAQAAFEQAAGLDPALPKPRFFLAVAAAQEGDFAAARAGWERIASESPPGSPWQLAAGEALKSLPSAAAGSAPGPSADDVAAAHDMDPQARAEMIDQMVAGLDERLRTQPDDMEGWQRLIRAYVVLGRRDAARDALLRATQAFDADPQKAEDVRRFARGLGLSDAAEGQSN